MTDKDNIILQKSLDFSVRIYKLSSLLKTKHKEFSLSDQILRSGTSIGANVHESSSGESKKDFISKISIALKEAKETEYWLTLLYKVELITKEQYESIHNDCFEIIKILTKIRHTSRNNNSKTSGN